MTNHRLERLRAILHERELPALLVSSPLNRRYLSGFRGSNGTLLITQQDERPLLFSDFRYRIQAAREAPEFELREASPERQLHTLVAEALDERGLAQLAVEGEHTSVAQWHKQAQAVREHFGARPAPELQAVEGLVEALREVKDADELAILRRAIAITDEAFVAVLPQLRPEHSERQAAWMLEVAMRERGADGPSFPIIVAAGPNSALPHAQPGDEPLGAGRPLLIDMGARLDGYHADLTRTITLGAPDERFYQIYDSVLGAQRHALAELRAGLTGAEADALARDLIAQAGYGEHFGHGLGHGVGLNIHEGPALRRTSTQTLQAGSVFSVEPGIYLEGWGGVRIEDLVLLRADGAEQLSQAPKLRP
jgi:Xaa-Pro aminopeptidase